MFVTRANLGKLIEQLLSTFRVPTSPFFRVRWLYYYGFRGVSMYSMKKAGGRRKMGKFGKLIEQLLSNFSVPSQVLSLKGQCHEIFDFWFFS